jgi:hypothetical protein
VGTSGSKSVGNKGTGSVGGDTEGSGEEAEEPERTPTAEGVGEESEEPERTPTAGSFPEEREGVEEEEEPPRSARRLSRWRAGRAEERAPRGRWPAGPEEDPREAGAG